jgi:hypothetical protein
VQLPLLSLGWLPLCFGVRHATNVACQLLFLLAS